MITKNFALQKGINPLFSVQTNGLYRYVGELPQKGVSLPNGETGWMQCRISNGEFFIHMDSCGDCFLFSCDEQGKVTVETKDQGFITFIEDATSTVGKSNLFN